MADKRNEVEADGKSFDSPMDESVEEAITVKDETAQDLYRIQQYYQRFRKAELYKADIVKRWTVLDEFDRGEQWKNVAVPPWVPKPVTNLIRFVRTLKRANLASAIPKPTFYAEYPEDKDMVNSLQLAHNHVWEKEHLDRLVRLCIDRSLLLGTTIAMVYTDDTFVGGKYFGTGDNRNLTHPLYRGAIKVKRIPNGNFFPDPDAYNLEMCKYVEITEILPINTVKNTKVFRDYCQEKGTLDKLDNFKSPQLEMDSEADGTIFERDHTPENTNLLNTPGDYLINVHQHWERYVGEDNKWHVDVSYYIRNSDFFLLRIEDVKPSEYPFAVLYDEPEEQDFWGTSTAMDILENQKIVNKVQQISSILGVLHQNPQKVVLRESGINAQELARTGTLPGKVWTSNVPNPVETIEPMQIPKELFDLDDRTQKNIKDTVGVNEAYTGQSVGSLTTSTGVSDLIDRATIRDKDKMVEIDCFVERLSSLICQFIIHKWDKARQIASVQPNGDVQYRKWEPLDDTAKENLEWRIKSDVYAKAPSTQATRRQQANQLLQVQAQGNFSPAVITPEEYIRMMEFDLSADILKRMDADRQILAQQQQQQPPQLPQSGEFAVSLSSKDANFINQLLGSQLQAAKTQQQLQAELMQNHPGNGVNVTPQATGADVAAGQPQAPQGVTGQVAMNNMAKGQG